MGSKKIKLVFKENNNPDKKLKKKKVRLPKLERSNGKFLMLCNRKISFK